MACDMCGKAVSDTAALVDGYATDEIKQVCPSCEKQINRFVWKARKLSNNFIFNLAKEMMQDERKRSGVFK